MRLLLGPERTYSTGPLSTSELPEVPSIAELASHLRDGRSALEKYDVDELIALYNASGVAELDPPTYSRVITVRAVADINSAARQAHRDVQTIGLALGDDRRLEFARIAARRGAARFPVIGRMTHFDNPWDGLMPMERMVRWVTVGGP